MDLNHLNLRVRDAGACRDFYERHFGFHPASRRRAATSSATTVEDSRPGEDHVTFRCWDPDGTEIEVFWERTA